MKTARLSLSGGWKGLVALTGPDGQTLDLEEWKDCLCRPSDLVENAENVLKTDGPTRVVSRHLAVGPHRFEAVLKRHVTKPGPLAGFRSVFPSRSMQTFELARRLLRAGLDTPWPLAALERRDPFRGIESILVTEHLTGAVELYRFVQEAEQSNLLVPSMHRLLCHQTVLAFTTLTQCGLWHRDAKASNFLVRKEADSVQLWLVDLDGIKPIMPWDRTNQTRGLAKLAATLGWSGRIGATDLLRIVNEYARVFEWSLTERNRLFRSLWQRAVAERLTTFIATAEHSE